jgi:hypothetical protein
MRWRYTLFLSAAVAQPQRSEDPEYAAYLRRKASHCEHAERAAELQTLYETASPESAETRSI